MDKHKRRHPKEIGELSQLNVMVHLMEYGCVLSSPYGDNAPYDLIVDINGNLFRCQIKTGKLKNGVIRFNTCKNRSNTQTTFKEYYTKKEIDLFLVYCYETLEVYCVRVGNTSGILRVSKTKNNQLSKIRMAVDYTLDKFMSALRET